MSEITGVWMSRDHTRLVIERDGSRSVLAINIDDTSSSGAPNIRVLSTGDAMGPGAGDWVEMIPEYIEGGVDHAACVDVSQA